MIKCELIVSENYSDVENAEVLVIIKNASNAPIRILEWGTPLEGFLSNFLIIKKEGKAKLPYIGIKAKRGNAKDINFINVPGNGSVQANVNISDGYSIHSSGGYKIKASFYITTEKNGEFDIVKCESAYYKINFAQKKSKEYFTVRERIQELKEITFYKGIINFDKKIQHLTVDKIYTQDRKEEIEKIVLKFEDCIKKVINHLKKLSTPEYIKWFGAFDEKRWCRVFFVCMDIFFLITHDNIPIEEYGNNCYETDDRKRKLAYVNDCELRIYVCEEFWKLPFCGRDSKIGVIFHELSHLAGGTDDKISLSLLNEQLCINLAANAPEDAIENADNYEFFIEDICCA